MGEIFQAIADESSQTITATRRLNKHDSYKTGLRARRLDTSRRVHIRGGTFKANGNTEDLGITTRADAIQVIGFVDPLIEDVTFDHPWARGIKFQCCGAPRWSNITVRNVGNLANANGYVYGVVLYGMNDQADGRNIVVRNGRHAGFTTDGNTGSSTWYNKGIPTNAYVFGVHGYNTHGSVIDTHEEGDTIVFESISSFYGYQDADIAGSFTGLAVQLRCSNCTIRNLVVRGGTRGIKINALDHGVEDKVVLENIQISNLTQGSSANNDVGLQIDDQSALTNKRHVYLSGTMTNVGKGITVGRSAKLTIRSLDLIDVVTAIDAGAGSQIVATGEATFDYRVMSRSGQYSIVQCRSDATYGGSSTVFMRDVNILKPQTANANLPTALFAESDTAASKTIYCPAIREYNRGGLQAILYKTAGSSTLANGAIIKIASAE